MRTALRRLKARLRREEGTASIEFVLAVPVLMTIFMASFESGLFMVRHVMLEQALDHTMRELRLNHLGNVTVDSLRQEICDRTVVLNDCESNMMLELQPINTATFAMPATPTSCVNRGAVIAPDVPPFIRGGPQDLMIVRACIVQDPMFPMTGIGLRMPKDGQGGYGIVALSIFANEPS